MLIFQRRQQWYHLFGCEVMCMLTELLQPKVGTIWCICRRDLAVHKDHLPHHRMTSQSALLLWCHLLTVGNIIKCLHDDISGPCVSLWIIVPEWAWTVPLMKSKYYCKVRKLQFILSFLCKVILEAFIILNNNYQLSLSCVVFRVLTLIWQMLLTSWILHCWATPWEVF